MCLTAFFAVWVVGVNFYIDHYGVRLSLFSGEGEINQTIYPDGLNQHIFNPEFIFRNPEKFDSFLFGSSRISMMKPETIPTGHFFNMSYSQGLPIQHLAIIRAFLKRGVKVRSVVIGLDEFCFALPSIVSQDHLLRVMHPDAGGPGRLEIFRLYFFRKPDFYELERWRNRVWEEKKEGRFVLDGRGLNLGWLPKDHLIEKTEHPIFLYAPKRYEPQIYGKKEKDDALTAIVELIDLSRKHGFSITFFISPLYAPFYLNHALELFEIKSRLAQITDFYDFSGFNPVTTNPLNYYDESHYSYRIGDRIIRRMLDSQNDNRDNFGIRVTSRNVAGHIATQKRDLHEYLKIHHPDSQR